MASLTPRRKPATELETRLSTGLSVEPRDIIAVIDQPMHEELVYTFGSELSSDEREGLACDVLLELLEESTKYDVARSSLEHYAKLRVRTIAVAYLRERTKTRKQQAQFNDHGYLTVAPVAQPGPVESAEDAAAIAAAVQRVKLELLRLPLNYRLAAEAYQRFGPERYATELARELKVSPNLVSQWFTRAKKKILKAASPYVKIFE
jgi:DNA-directed RNA polymerase specialized sigma subunit